jgi:adenine-specific DNA-methyltransferase
LPRGELVVSNAEAECLKPLFPAEEIHRYVDLAAAKSEIIYIRGAIAKGEESLLLVHLERYREVMEDRRENKTGRIKYYNLHWPRSQSFFEPGPKVLSIRKCAVPTFTYTTQEAYVMMSVNVIRTKRVEMKYLTGLLNSRLIRFWLKHKGKMQGNNFQIDKEPLLSIPIANGNPASQIQVAELVKKIYSRRGSQEAHEAKIDSLIYEEYGITRNEIITIEEAIGIPAAAILVER